MAAKILRVRYPGPARSFLFIYFLVKMILECLCFFVLIYSLHVNTHQCENGKLLSSYRNSWLLCWGIGWNRDFRNSQGSWKIMIIWNQRLRNLLIIWRTLSGYLVHFMWDMSDLSILSRLSLQVISTTTSRWQLANYFTFAANEYEPLLGSKGLTPALYYMERLRDRFPNPWDGLLQVDSQFS